MYLIFNVFCFCLSLIAWYIYNYKGCAHKCQHFLKVFLFFLFCAHKWVYICAHTTSLVLILCSQLYISLSLHLLLYSQLCVHFLFSLFCAHKYMYICPLLAFLEVISIIFSIRYHIYNIVPFFESIRIYGYIYHIALLVDNLVDKYVDNMLINI